MLFGESELEWMAVTPGGMKVLSLHFSCFFGGGKKQLTKCTLAGAIYTYHSVQVSLLWVTSFAWVAFPKRCRDSEVWRPKVAHVLESYWTLQ